MADVKVTELREKRKEDPVWEVPVQPQKIAQLKAWPSCGCADKARFVFLDKLLSTDMDWSYEFDRRGREVGHNPNYLIGHIGCRSCGREWKMRWELGDNFVEFTEVEKDADVSA